ncbi:MAG: DedA family protein [Gammaproteobacteria bacterium]|nr:DedA family protein [Gammaproteobacteria bacterium]
MIDSTLPLITLFISGFTSATLLPGSSEALFLLMLSQQNWDTGFLILIVGIGNSLGGMSNWVLGILIRTGFHKDKDKDKNQETESKYRVKAEKWLKNYGSPVLFFSFLPIIGDPLCLVAGLVKTHWLQALLYISLGKFFRYFILSYAVYPG